MTGAPFFDEAGMSNRSLDSKYAKWAKEVKERFGWRCALCGSRDGVVAHHIVPYAVDEANRLNPDNGIALCEKHHKAAHESSNVCNKGRAKANKIDDEIIDSIIGMYFHSLDDERYVVNQGRIIGKENEFYIVQLFDWVIGAYSVIQTRCVKEFLCQGKINLYRTSEDMNWWYEYKARKDYENMGKAKKRDSEQGMKFLTIDDILKNKTTATGVSNEV